MSRSKLKFEKIKFEIFDLQLQTKNTMFNNIESREEINKHNWQTSHFLYQTNKRIALKVKEFPFRLNAVILEY